MSFEPSYSHHPVEDIEPEQNQHVKEEACLLFRRAFAFMLDGGGQRQRSMRFHVFCMVLFPDLLHQTCQTIANDHGVSRYAVDKIALDLRDRYAISSHIQNRAQRNNSTRERCKQSQLNQYQSSSKRSKNSISRLRSMPTIRLELPAMPSPSQSEQAKHKPHEFDLWLKQAGASQQLRDRAGRYIKIGQMDLPLENFAEASDALMRQAMLSLAIILMMPQPLSVVSCGPLSRFRRCLGRCRKSGVRFIVSNSVSCMSGSGERSTLKMVGERGKLRFQHLHSCVNQGKPQVIVNQ